MVKFTDFNFKLMVLQELMYNKESLIPQFDVYDFAESHTKRKINIEKEGYKIIPEVEKYFQDIDIPKEMLESIKELSQDGGDDIYIHLCPFWDGEDDLFNIKSVDDCSLLPNLKKVTIFYDKDESIIDKFKSKGIDASFV
ncbi:MAG: hypothetical protein A2086_04265 [Spirochaetes bacterium GWD1_27_9]|nr:MAG: hypothetical protein A2Z98_18060 [Spirochaetes bacterium GWB1_27_13]OHD23036.1 MAG: hypothetical protein A2Y34_17800 [Spirochaetes bacterium GWC1_27_15]OHD41372.1 MAG: hypothetical protein A2086_04265 [Spirochaetes bacterium GWD1_27_9]